MTENTVGSNVIYSQNSGVTQSLVSRTIENVPTVESFILSHRVRETKSTRTQKMCGSFH